MRMFFKGIMVRKPIWYISKNKFLAIPKNEDEKGKFAPKNEEIQ